MNTATRERIPTRFVYPESGLPGAIKRKCRVVRGYHQQMESTGKLKRQADGSMEEETVLRIYRARNAQDDADYQGDIFETDCEITQLNDPRTTPPGELKFRWVGEEGGYLPQSMTNPFVRKADESIEAFQARIFQMAAQTIEQEKQNLRQGPSISQQSVSAASPQGVRAVQPSQPTVNQARPAAAPQPTRTMEQIAAEEGISVPQVTGAVPNNVPAIETLKTMNLTQIIKWGSENSMDLRKCKSKEEALKVIQDQL